METQLAHNHKNKFLAIFENIEVGICLVSLVGMTIITGIAVITRYLFGFSFTWTEEICRFLVIWATFGGSAYAFKKGSHIGVTALVNIFPNGIQKITSIVIKIVTIGFFVLIGYYGLINTLTQYANNQLAPATQITVAVPYSAIPIGSVLVIIRLIIEILSDIKGRPELEMEAEN